MSLPVTRQELFSMWSDATLGTIDKTDMAPGIFTADRASHLTEATSSPIPGHSFYAQAEELLYIYHDEVADTGVSLWLAVGPDRFDVACCAVEPIPAGAAVEPVVDRYVRVATEASNHAGLTAIGMNQAGIDFDDANTFDTTASGAWFPVCIDGVAWCYIAPGEETTKNRMFRISSTMPGSVEESSSGSPTPTIDDVVGLAYASANNTAGTTQLRTRAIWSGPKLWKAL